MKLFRSVIVDASHRTVPVVTGGEGPHTQGTFSERLNSINCQHGARENLHIWGEFASENEGHE